MHLHWLHLPWLHLPRLHLHLTDPHPVSSAHETTVAMHPGLRLGFVTKGGERHKPVMLDEPQFKAKRQLEGGVGGMWVPLRLHAADKERFCRVSLDLGSVSFWMGKDKWGPVEDLHMSPGEQDEDLLDRVIPSIKVTGTTLTAF